jgi:hypothetical protein
MYSPVLSYSTEIFMKRYALCLLLPFFLVGVAVAEPFQFAEDDDKKQLSLSDGTLPVLTYQYDMTEHRNVPQNNPRRFAGCYVHPLHGLRGEILTDNAPADHYHHHGVFWTWPHVAVHESGEHEPDGKVTEYNLWESNSALKQHFVRWIDKTISEQTATFEVENGWFIGNPQNGKKVMTERVKVIVHRVHEANGVKSRAIDFEFLWQPTDKPITLRGAEDKSYGGFTVRFKPFVVPRLDGRNALGERNDANRITVPGGAAEGDLTETPLPWADYTSFFPVITPFITTSLRPSGAAIFVPKTPPDFPPTWLTRYYGPLCVGWPGVKGRTFQPGEEINLRYRIWIHAGAVTVPQIEKAYEEYNESHTVVWQRRRQMVQCGW